jgi:hypothetical protein
VAGRPAVSYVDVPAGASTNIIQTSQLKLTQPTVADSTR